MLGGLNGTVGLELPADGLSDGVVRLRRWTPSDVDHLTEVISGDREISRWTRIPWPYTRDLAEEWIAGDATRFDGGTDVTLAITSAGDGRLLGSIGLHRIGARPEPGSALFPDELGYWLTRDARGRGTCTRAGRLLITWAFETIELERVEASTVVGNDASRRVLDRLGFRAAGQVDGLDDDPRRLHHFVLDRGSFTLSS